MKNRTKNEHEFRYKINSVHCKFMTNLLQKRVKDEQWIDKKKSKENIFFGSFQKYSEMYPLKWNVLKYFKFKKNGQRVELILLLIFRFSHSSKMGKKMSEEWAKTEEKVYIGFNEK